MSTVGYVQPAIGYRTSAYRNPAGAARIGLSGLGDDSSTMASWGFSPGQIQQILQAHATGALSDNGFQFLLQGGVPTTDLANFLNQDPGAPASGPTPAQPAPGVPTGSTLTYSGTWQTSTQYSTAGGVLTAVLAALRGFGIQVLGQDFSIGVVGALKAGTYTPTPFTVTISLSVSGPGFGQQSDVAAIIDHQVYQVTGAMPLGSNIVIGSVPGNATAPPSTSLATWFEQNATWLFLGVGALVVIGGRR